MGTIGLLISAMAVTAADAAQGRNLPDVRVLVVTGGHDFERPQFFAMFDAMKGVSWSEAAHPDANTHYGGDATSKFDVLVLYDMWQDIGERQKADLLSLVKDNGKGVVALHHCLADYPKWPEFHAMIGGTYFLEDTTVNGVKHAKSTYDHGQALHIQIADPADPVTKGVKDFDMVDEIYGGFTVAADVKPLVKVDYPNSGPIIGWSKTYGKGRVVYLQSGHDHIAYENENYRALVRNAILWVSQKQGAK